ncbi:hypothetical protein LTR95_014641 [Oleoguttula sp. CCFEE 5521]
MALSGFLFISWRIFEIIILIPIVGMLAYFVHIYVKNAALTPNYILVLFIVAVLALAWAVATLLNYFRARHDAFFVAAMDLAFVGALIAGVVVLRGIANANCVNFSSGSFSTSLGSFRASIGNGQSASLAVNKTCVMLKASWALAIIAILAFFVTFLLALLVHRNHRNDDKVVVKREYHTSRHGHRRSTSRGARGSRDYDRPRSSQGRSTHRSSSRRQYYV